jgi:hypothetical protein
MRIEVYINTNDIIRQLRGLSDIARKGITRSMNDAAFSLRKEWISDIERDIDNPKAFTKKVFVRKAKNADAQALTFFPDLQARYLQHVLEGEDRQVGDYATLSGSILAPVSARLNKFGNFAKGPTRWLATVEDRLKGGFVGTPGQDGRMAVYQEKRKGLKLLAVFKKRTEYDKSLDLETSAAQALTSFDSIVQKNFNYLLK